MVHQLGQALLVRHGHAAAEWIVHGRHGHDRGDAAGGEQRFQCFQIEAVPRMGGQLDRAQAQAAQQRVDVEIRGRFDRDRIAGLGHHAQRQLQGFHRAMGEHQPVGGGVQPQPWPSLHDLRQQPCRTVGTCVGLHRGGGPAQYLRGTAGQLRTGIEALAARPGEGQVDDARLLLCGQHARHHRLLCRCGGRRRRLPQRLRRFGQTRADHEAGLGPRQHQPGILQLPIRGDHRVEAEAALCRQAAQRRQPGADRQAPTADRVGHFIGQGLVEVGRHRHLHPRVSVTVRMPVICICIRLGTQPTMGVTTSLAHGRAVCAVRLFFWFAA